jgi:hypothetical protein
MINLEVIYIESPGKTGYEPKLLEVYRFVLYCNLRQLKFSGKTQCYNYTVITEALR